MDEDLSDQPQKPEKNEPISTNRSWLFLQGLSIFIIGAGIGWIAGLSVSPVVSIILTSLLGIVTGFVTGARSANIQKSGNKNEQNFNMFDAIPVALLVIGIALFAPVGILARTYHIFEPPELRNASTQSNPTQTGTNVLTIALKAPQDQGVLFKNYDTECNMILGQAITGNKEAFLNLLENSQIPNANTYVSKFGNDPETLIFWLKELCSLYNPR